MRTRAIFVGVTAGALLMAGVGPATAATAGLDAASGGNVLRSDPDTRVQQAVLALVNAERAEHGCPELSLDRRLISAAREHAAEMAGHVYFAHTSLDGEGAGERVREAGYDWSGYAENIARGQDNPSEVVDDWMSSSAHRENILDCALREVGVGLAFDDDHEPYWVQDFGTADPED